MIFCGQCGLQLPPGSTRCRRCGAAVEPAETAGSGDLHMDDATVASRAFIVQDQRPPQTPNSQQPLILRGNSGYDNGMQDPGGATSRVEQVSYNGQMPPTQQVVGNAYSGYPPQPTGGYAPLQSGGGYPVQNTGAYPPQVSHPGYNAYQQPGLPYTDAPLQMVSGYQQYPTQYPVQQRASNAKGRTTGLILVFIGLLLILGAAVLFAIQQGLIKGVQPGTGYSGASSAVAIVARQHVAAAPQHYSYSYINQQSQMRFVVTVEPSGATRT